MSSENVGDAGMTDEQEICCLMKNVDFLKKMIKIFSHI